MDNIEEVKISNRALILYILSKINIPVSPLHLIDIVVGNRFMDYFSMQDAVSELAEAGMISSFTENDKNYYTVTEEGAKAVDLLTELVPQGILKRFNNQLPEIRLRIKRDLEVNASFYPDAEDNYYSRLFVRDGDIHLVDIAILAGSKKYASEICENWKKYTKEIYSEIIDSLLKSRE